jgi:hypothetical protein
MRIVPAFIGDYFLPGSQSNTCNISDKDLKNGRLMYVCVLISENSQPFHHHQSRFEHKYQPELQQF